MSILQYSTLIVAILFFMLIHRYWRRNRVDGFIPCWPILGILPAILCNVSNFHDYFTEALKHHGGTFQFKGPWFTNTNFIITSDPMNVHHVTSKNFGNYGKGIDFHEIFEILGGGIFNADSNQWKQDRTILHSLLKRESFEIFLQQVIKKKLENCLLPFLDDASKASAHVDLQDVFGRFTFDSTCTILFGFDPNCLPHKFTHELSKIAYVEAIPVIEEAILYRHFIPKRVWKLQRWLQIGQEKKYKVAQEKLDQFMHECLAYSKSDEKQRRFMTSTEGVDKCDFHLVKALMKEGYRKGQMDVELETDKYLKDTALNLLIAGNSTINGGLSWFFWLVSSHPIVEDKIIQEIKDKCQTQEGLISSIAEELDKLVYLHGAICEALRLFPPVPFEHKCAIKSDTLPSGDRVGPNTKVSYFMYSMGRMEQTWGEDCLEFKPERWISERGNIAHVPSYKFITFNAGPRTCLGKDISLIQLKIVAAAVLCKFHVQVVEGHPVTPRPSVVLRMKHGLKVKLTKRCINI